MSTTPAFMEDTKGGFGGLNCHTCVGDQCSVTVELKMHPCTQQVICFCLAIMVLMVEDQMQDLQSPPASE
jgi:hypothetical protein